MRLTKLLGTRYFKKSGTFFTWDLLEDKLGQLEDIEEKLGISLVIFIKCLYLIDSHEFRYVKWIDKEEGWYEELWTPIEVGIDMKNKYFFNSTNKKEKLLFEEYGITWALTKKELE